MYAHTGGRCRFCGEVLTRVEALERCTMCAAGVCGRCGGTVLAPDDGLPVCRWCHAALVGAEPPPYPAPTSRAERAGVDPGETPKGTAHSPEQAVPGDGHQAGYPASR